MSNTTQSKTDGCIIYKNGQTATINYGGTMVPDDMFAENEDIVSVSLPNSVEVIGNHAFSACTELTEMNIPNSVTRIGHGAFFLTNLEELHIPASVTFIGEDIANSYVLNYIFVDINNPKYCSKGNCLIDTDTQTLMLGCSRSFIPDDGSVTKIVPNAFFGCEFPYMDIPESVQVIGSGAFEDCRSLNKLYIRKTIKSIENGAFKGCASLVIHYSGTLEQWKKVYTGYDVKVIPNAKMPNEKQGVIQYKNGKTNIIPYEVEFFRLVVFLENDDDEVIKVVLPRNVKKIVPKAFSNCKTLKEVHVPESVILIDESAFEGCPALTVYYDGSPRGWKKIYPKNDVKVVCKRKFF